MAKEQPKKEPASRSVKTTAAELRNIAKRLHDAATQIEAQAEKMKQEKKDAVMLEGRAGVEGDKGVFWSLGKLLASCNRHIKQF